MLEIDCYFDFFSPYSYLASHRLPEVARRYGAKINYHPVDNQVIKRGAGTIGAPNHSLPRKYRYLRADLTRWARRYGIPLHSPAKVSEEDHAIVGRVNRGLIWAQRQNAEQAYITAAFEALWGRGDPRNEQILRTIAAKAGLSADGLVAGIDSAEVIREYERGMAEAQECGVFGVPTFIVDGQLFWGNDRIEIMERYLREPSKALPY
jgi:2-hydroxychromene-2-carboxylate isomerase